MVVMSRLLLTLLPLSLVACTPPTAEESPPAPATSTRQVSPTATGSSVAYQGIRFSNPLPGTQVEARSVAATPPQPDTPPGDEAPAHIVFDVQTYYPNLFPSNGWYMLPQLVVYETDQFAQYGFDQEQTDLQGLLTRRPNLSTLPELPYLPIPEAAQVFHAADAYLQFEGGAGIRYITAYAQDVSPVTAPQVFYTFQGLMDDGRYVSATFPIKTAIFPDTVEGLEGQAYDDFVATFDEYLTGIRDRTNQANPATDFTPPLTQLDALIESIRVE